MSQPGWRLVEADREKLQMLAQQADVALERPAASWQVLEQNAVFRWSIPTEYGGLGLSSVEQLIRLEELAACCLTTTFILSQHESAVRQVLKGPVPLRRRYLPDCAVGKDLLTVGLSQLTTSRQHGRPFLVATSLANGHYQLDGTIPWVTAADQCSAIIGGATLANDDQFLFVLPTHRPGIVIEPPMTLSGLAGSRTTAVQCHKVILHADEMLTQPVEQVLRQSGGGGLDTSCLAIGLSRAALDLVRPEAQKRVEVAKTLESMDPELQALRSRLHSAVSSPAQRDEVLRLRSDCTLFVLRCTQIVLLLTKGTGFIAPHAAQRLARQALFFLVWSCPRPAAESVWSSFLQSVHGLNRL